MQNRARYLPETLSPHTIPRKDRAMYHLGPVEDTGKAALTGSGWDCEPSSPSWLTAGSPHVGSMLAWHPKQENVSSFQLGDFHSWKPCNLNMSSPGQKQTEIQLYGLLDHCNPRQKQFWPRFLSPCQKPWARTSLAPSHPTSSGPTYVVSLWFYNWHMPISFFYASPNRCLFWMPRS